MDTDRDKILDAADALFYAHGIQVVSMDRIRDASGVPLKRLYRCFPSKGAIVEAYLHRRDRLSRTALEEFLADYTSPNAQILALFDWLYAWIEQPGFRGCAFNNAFGELGGEAEAVTRAVQDHKSALHARFHDLVRETEAPDPKELTSQLVVLFDGVITVASHSGSPEPAHHARTAMEALLSARAPA